MSSESDLQPEISLLSGDDGFCIRTFLARETSLNHQSYDLFYREPEGIPFRWEAQPGTPRKYPQQDGLTSTTTPLSPSPLMQSLKLHPPDHEGSTMLKSSKVESFKKLVRRSIAFNRDKVQKKEPLRFGESVKDSSMFDSGSCFINGNVAGVALQYDDEEENKAKATTPIPRDEMQPDRPKQQRGSDLIQPPPSAPPPRPHDDREKHGGSAWTKKASFWLKGSRGRRKTRKFGRERSFSCPENMEKNDSVEEFDYSSRRNMSKSSSSSASNGNSEALKMKGANYFSCGSWKGMKRDS